MQFGFVQNHKVSDGACNVSPNSCATSLSVDPSENSCELCCKEILLLSISLLNLILAVAVAVKNDVLRTHLRVLTFVHRRWFSLKHVSVEHRTKNEKQSGGKNDEFFLQNKKTSFIAFYQFKFISFLS